MIPNRLWDKICRTQMPDVFNPWCQKDGMDLGDGPDQRRKRLQQHFACPEPRYLLIGEAPGYQGCHWSGVPFTSERQLVEGLIPRMDVLHGRITSRRLPWSEPSATIVWDCLHALRIANETVLWNAFPWHPHDLRNSHKNRTPTKDELLSSAEILRGIVKHFNGVKVVAVGRKAETLLTYLLGQSPKVVRHPANGGANKFRAGMEKLVRTNKREANDSRLCS